MRINSVLLVTWVCLLLLSTYIVDASESTDKSPESRSSSSYSSTKEDDSPPPKNPRDDDPVIVEVRGLRNSAMQLSDKRRYDLAIDKLRDAIVKMHSRVFGEDREKVTKPSDQSMDAALYSQLLGDYGTVLIRTEQYTEATDVLKDALEMIKRIYGPSHPSYGLTLRSLADAYMHLKHYNKAIKTYKTLKKHVKEGLGVGHEAYVEAYLRIGEAYKGLKNYEEEIKAYKKVLEDQGQYINPEIAGIAEVYLELATAQTKLKQYEDAAMSAQLAADMFKRREGKKLNYAFALNALAGVRMYEKNLQEAKELMKKAHKIAKKELPAHHEIVKQSARMLRDIENQIEKTDTIKEEL